MQEIESYQLVWSPTKGSAFRFKLKGIAGWTQWVDVTPSDLAAIAAILNEQPVYYNRQNGAIHTGAEPAGL